MQQPAYRFGPYRLDPAARELWKDGARVALPPRAFSCLLLLIRHHDRALGRDELIAALWRHGAASDVQLGQLIVQCRRALDDDGQRQWAIRTVPGFGYRWVAPLAEGADEAPAADGPPAPAPAPAAPVPDLAPAAPPVVAAAPRRRSALPRRMAAGAAAAVVALALLAAFGLRGRSAPPADGRVIVLPLATDADEEAGWLRLGGMDLVAERLRRSGLGVQPSDVTIGLLQRLPGGEPRDPAQAAAALRASAPPAAIVDGRIERRDGRWHARLAAAARDAPGLQAAFDDATPVGALRGAADRLSAAFGRVPPPQATGDAAAETLQRARAALLANQPEAARAILLADAALARDEPRLRQQLAEVDIRAGRLDAARATLDALLAGAGGDAAFRAELLAALGTIAVRSGRYADAARLFGEGIDAVGDAGDPLLLGRLHNGRAIGRTSLEDYAGALFDYGLARAGFERAGDAGGVARVDGNIGAMELLRGHPAQAEPYLAGAIERFGELGLVQERIGELQLLYEALRAQLKNAQAFAAMEASWAQRERIVSPYSRLSMQLYRAGALLQQGRHNEAAQLLDAANDTRPADVAETERIRLLGAELDWRRGRGADALALLAPIPDAPLASADSDLIRADVELLRARILRSLEAPGADAAPARTAAAADATALAPDPAAVNARTPLRRLAAANRAWARGDAAGARQAFEAAFALAQAQGVAVTIVRVAADYVPFLLAHGEPALATVVAGQVAVWAADDYEAALVQLRVAHAAGRRDAWEQALAAAQRLAGEREIPRALVGAPAG